MTENAKKYLIEVFDSEQRVRVALPPPSSSISQQTKTSLDWNPRELDRPILAVAGHNEENKGVVHLLQLGQNSQVD